MHRLIDYFGSSFLVNLPERVDRLDATRRELARAGSGPGQVELWFDKVRVARGVIARLRGLKQMAQRWKE